MSDNLVYLSKALPIENRGIYLRKKFNDSLLNSFKYLLDVCEDVIDTNHKPLIFEKINSLNSDMKFSGFLSVLHDALYNSAEKNDIKRVKLITDIFLRTDFIIDDMRYLDLDQLEDNFFTDQIKEIIHKETTSIDVQFSVLSSSEFERGKTVIEDGFEILKCTLPNFFQEIGELISEITLINGGNLQGTSTCFFGMIYKNPLYNLAKITDTLDFIIHEESHLYLHLLLNEYPLVLNEFSEKHASPLRKEKRPLLGVYHATFVLGRIIYVLSILKQLNKIPNDEINYCENLIQHYKDRFSSGFNTLKSYARMTELGSQLIEDTQRITY